MTRMSALGLAAAFAAMTSLSGAQAGARPSERERFIDAGEARTKACDKNRRNTLVISTEVSISHTDLQTLHLSRQQYLDQNARAIYSSCFRYCRRS